MNLKDNIDKMGNEIIEFRLDKNFYGINAEIVKEIVTYQPVTPAPNAHPCVEGIFMPRDKMITAIDLKNCLQMGSSKANGLFIVTEINGIEIAFHIDNVIGIHKVMQDEIVGVGFSATEDGYAQGVIKKDNKLIIILDFEKILNDINMEEIA